MTELNGHELKKLYYSIGEVAKIFDVNASLIRFWEKEFAFTVSKKNKKGNRLFSVKDIQNFNKIYHLVKEKGYTLDGAKKALTDPVSAESSATFDKQRIITDLEGIKSKLLDLKTDK